MPASCTPQPATRRSRSPIGSRSWDPWSVTSRSSRRSWERTPDRDCSGWPIGRKRAVWSGPQPLDPDAVRMPSVTTTSGLSAVMHLRSSRFRALIGMVLFIMLGFGLIIPALPSFARSFDVREGGVGLVLAAFAATRLLGDTVAGSMIDRWGERVIAAIGAGIVGLSSLSAGAAPSFTWLVVFRGAGGVGSAFFLGALTSYLIGTIAPDERGRASGVFQASIGIGITIGPLFGGLLSAVSPRLPLYVYGVVCLATMPMCLGVLRGRSGTTTVTLATVPGLLEECPA